MDEIGVLVGKIGFVFPGQGAQYVGMGKDFYEQIPEAAEMFRLATKASGVDVEGICFKQNEEINITEYTQIAMLATEVAILKAIEGLGWKADVTAGLSLGEYGALVASGVMSPEDVFKVVRQRGILMQSAVPSGGAMTAVLGLDASIIEQICCDTEGIVSIANYNCPGQIVITGEKEAVDRASEALTKAGAKRCISLNVSGPFHSAMLNEAGDKLGEVLDEVQIMEAKVPYLANVTAGYVTDVSEVKRLLKTQVAASVKWQQIVERMIADGVDTFVEIGPGKTLCGFIKKINRDVTAINIEKVEDLQKLKELI
jgi:[acyl-carrier-protein] S-malonyltransferase